MADRVNPDDVAVLGQLLDEYMEWVSPTRTAARTKHRTDARDWVAAYVERFGR